MCFFGRSDTSSLGRDGCSQLAYNGCSVALPDSFCESRPLDEKFPHLRFACVLHIHCYKYRKRLWRSHPPSVSMSLVIPLASLPGARHQPSVGERPQHCFTFFVDKPREVQGVLLVGNLNRLLPAAFAFPTAWRVPDEDAVGMCHSLAF